MFSTLDIPHRANNIRSGIHLEEGDVQVWIATVQQNTWLLRQHAKLLSPSESKRSSRYRFETDRASFILRRILLRMILGTYLGIDPGMITYRTTEGGKPVLNVGPKERMIYFSLSRSLGNVALGFTDISEIGIDIEQVSSLPGIERLAMRFFTKREADVIRNAPEAKRNDFFFRLWTSKEAVLKALGVGISFGLDKVEVELDTQGSPRQIRVKGETGIRSQWNLQMIQFPPSIVGAVAYRGERATLRCRHWRQEVSGIQQAAV